MKKTMRYLSMAALVVMGAIMASCVQGQGLDIEEELNTSEETVTLTVTVGLPGEPDTRALAYDQVNNKLVKTFAAGDKIKVFYYQSNSSKASVESEPLPEGVYGKTASFTFTLTNPKDGAKFRIFYPASMGQGPYYSFDIDNDANTIKYNNLKTQDGTLETLGGELDLCTYDGWISGTSIPESIQLTNRFAILAYTIKNSDGSADITNTITSMTISDGTNSYDVIRTPAEGPIYVAIRPVDNKNISYIVSAGTHYYYKQVSGKTYEAGNLYPLGLRMTETWNGDLSQLSSNIVVQDGQKLTGKLNNNVKISIAAGATVTLDNVTIKRQGYYNRDRTWAGLTCLGDATIILKDGTTNEVEGFHEDYPGIQAGPAGTTLIIKGSGSLTARSGNQKYIDDGYLGYGAGIGGGYQIPCGHIDIQGGMIYAEGKGHSSKGAAGIGSGYNSSCGNITISPSVISLTAIKGSGAKHSIGAGEGGTCGTVTFMGQTGSISTSPYTYPTKLFSISSTEQVYFAPGNLQAYNSSANSTDGWVWRFAEHQYDFIGNTSANTKVVKDASGKISEPGTVDLFCWSTPSTHYGISAFDNYENSKLSGDLLDWGNKTIANGNPQTGWRTLGDGEWLYLVNTRSASTINNIANARYTLARIDLDNGTYVLGLIIFPDLIIIGDDANISWGTAINQKSGTRTICTESQWNILEAKGCVFLPQAGYRVPDNGLVVRDINAKGYYWSSTFIDEYAIAGSSINRFYGGIFYFSDNDGVGTNWWFGKHEAMSVRLVRNAN